MILSSKNSSLHLYYSQSHDYLYKTLKKSAPYFQNKSDNEKRLIEKMIILILAANDKIIHQRKDKAT